MGRAVRSSGEARRRCRALPSAAERRRMVVGQALQVAPRPSPLAPRAKTSVIPAASPAALPTLASTNSVPLLPRLRRNVESEFMYVTSIQPCVSKGSKQAGQCKRVCIRVRGGTGPHNPPCARHPGCGRARGRGW